MELRLVLPDFRYHQITSKHTMLPLKSAHDGSGILCLLVIDVFVYQRLVFFFSLIASVYRRITFYCFVYSTMFLVCFLVPNTLLLHEGGDDSDGRGSVMRL